MQAGNYKRRASPVIGLIEVKAIAESAAAKTPFSIQKQSKQANAHKRSNKMSAKVKYPSLLLLLTNLFAR